MTTEVRRISNPNKVGSHFRVEFAVNLTRCSLLAGTKFVDPSHLMQLVSAGLISGNLWWPFRCTTPKKKLAFVNVEVHTSYRKSTRSRFAGTWIEWGKIIETRLIESTKLTGGPRRETNFQKSWKIADKCPVPRTLTVETRVITHTDKINRTFRPSNLYQFAN